MEKKADLSGSRRQNRFLFSIYSSTHRRAVTRAGFAQTKKRHERENWRRRGGGREGGRGGGLLMTAMIKDSTGKGEHRVQ